MGERVPLSVFIGPCSSDHDIVQPVELDSDSGQLYVVCPAHDRAENETLSELQDLDSDDDRRMARFFAGCLYNPDTFGRHQ